MLFVGVLLMIIGVAALVIYPPVNNIAPVIIGNEGDAIFFALTRDFSPPWLTILMAVGLVAAAMSTIDTCVNVMALSIAYDMFGLHRKNKGIKKSQIITILAVLAAGLFALNTESLWDIFYLSGGVLTTAVAFPLAAVIIPGVKKEGVFWSSAFGFIGTIVFYFLQVNGLLEPLQPMWLNSTDLAYILWGIILAVIGYHIGSFH